jgi:hypothetical protein
MSINKIIVLALLLVAISSLASYTDEYSTGATLATDEEQFTTYDLGLITINS